ncbi:substrate-binding domain-containing protein [Phytohabitans rumicis]|uniref:ABC transporter substrate-binding protein n=1 Tax=Phytohabitans rumicis TaxID=1076125 RepID=A0A6V8KTF6_9ACTN|nr:substrate-binding domain-containing protein [Phytohabitans rumicis]GFJ86710.1 ABC transporter substrate-binding protein [Phytohabitans rumicis]
MTTSRSRWRRVAAGVGTAALLLLASACSDTAESADGTGLKDGLGSRAQNRAAYFFTFYNPSADAFWNQMVSGAKDAAQLGRLTITDQTAEGDTGKMTDLIGAAIATKPAAVFVPFNDPAWENAACEADKAGIAVFAFNVPPADAAKSCVKAFVGQNFFEVGALVGERLVKEVSLQAGDKVLCPAEEPQQQYAIQRGGGVESVLKQAGVKCTYLRTSGADEQALNALTTWLGANKDVKAVVPLGGTPHRNLVAAEDAAGVKAPIVGFDTSPQVIEGIKSGRIIATADQQGYIQGFQTVMQAALFLDFGLSPANINSGGNSLIDKSNVELLEKSDLQGVRW